MRRSRRLNIENLEDRRVLSADGITPLTLVGVNANDGTLLVDGETRTVAPTDLTLVFSRGNPVDPSTLGSIQFVRSGADGIFGPDANDNNDDVVITPGFIGMGEEANEVLVRFAERLPDDKYQITVVGSGMTPLRGLDGCEFNNGVDTVVSFELDLGAQVVSVVPQPITRGSGGELVQARNQIDVYFNDDDLSVSSATNPDFYQLVFTGHANNFDPAVDTLSNADDQYFTPSTVTYDAAADKAVLTFSADLDQLAGVGTYRLRIGSSEAIAVNPVSVTPTDDPGSSFDTADVSIGTLTRESVNITGAVSPQDNPLVFPGSNQDPGHRQVSTAFDLHVPENGADVDPSVPVFAYNFQDVIGFSGGGTVPIQNLITENQKELVRQVFEVYAHYLGVEFVETDGAGLTVATGDVRAVVPAAFTDPELVPGVAGISTNLVPTAVMNSAASWSDDFGGNYYQQAMRQIGRALGMGATNDLPDGTVQGSNPELVFELPAEPIFPGDNDIVHGQYLFRPDGNDIDLYRFELTEPGTVSIETFAERLTDASSLDTHLRLYRQTADGPVLVSQNDDYFGEDSRINLRLDVGTYFVGVSSKGNDRYNPVIENTGAGGISQGEYELRLDFRPSVNESLVDTTGQALDGDGDGRSGGNYNFWFRVQDASGTIFVDKAASNGDGSIGSPFNNVRDAVAAAEANGTEGEIIRVVGNNLDTPSLTDDLPYQIGFANNSNTPLADGATDGSLRIPKSVTLMIDEGAIFKLRRGAIVAGSSSPFVDDSGASIQVLGTPTHSVIFTSLTDETKGADFNPQTTTPLKGDWGGILVRNDLDIANGQFNYEDSGIFLNSINLADISYGGGIVSNGFIPGVIVNPITMVRARATVSNNLITNSADAAMSASPNTFLESTFQQAVGQGAVFTSDYSRVGPDIRANVLTDNTTNGMTIANRFTSDELTMSVSGRFDDTSVVHVIQDNLEIAGVSGGPTGVVTDVNGTPVIMQTARPDGSLIVDPGTVVKVESSSIMVGLGANFYAEGNAVRPVVVTSLQDTRFGAGGTFRTSDSSGTAASADWGGIYFAPTSSGSFDHAVVAYGGGTSTVPGGFTGFNAIESHQGELRVTNSVLEFNGPGTGGVVELDRGGLGRNQAGTIFVAGDQSVIVDNIFRFNESAIVNINANALNYMSIVDTGRSTGSADVIREYQDNQGALVRNNQIERNGINGMVVRGGTLTTESVWDDTDVVHVLFDTIFIPNFHSFGGLRLKSSPDASLVVKLLGERTGGFVATGSASSVPQHIGGGLQVIGQPGSPVILTSFYDDTVGAGFDASGDTQVDTDGGRRPIRTSDRFEIQLNFGPVISQFPEIVASAQRAADIWEAQFQDLTTISIDVELGAVGGLLLDPGTNGINENVRLLDTDVQFLTAGFDNVTAALANDAGAHEPLLSQLPSFSQLNVNFPVDPVNPFTLSDQMVLTRANAKALGLDPGALTTVSQFNPDADLDGTIMINDNLENWDFDLKNGLATYREDFQTNFLREIGHVLGFESGVDNINVGLFVPAADRTVNLTPLDLFRFETGDGKADFTNATRQLDPRERGHVFYAGGDLDFTGFPIEGISTGEIPIATGFFDPELDQVNDSFGAGFWLDELFLQDDKLTVETAIGIMDPRSALRDNIFYFIDPIQTQDTLIVDITEADRVAFDAIGYDAVGPAPGQWEGLRFEEFSNDRNVPVVPEIESPDTPVPGLNDDVNSSEFIGNLAPNQFTGDDDTRLGFEVHGLIAAPGDVDVYRFNAQPGTEVWIDIDATAPGLDTVVELVAPNGAVLAGSDNSIAEVDDASTLVGLAQPFDNIDIYTTNIHDAGMRLVLPGPVDVETTYFVRVRGAGDTPTDVSGGKTAGRYEMQVRLQAQDEVPGSSVVLSEIHYADTGVRIIGPPTQSPLLGEHAETTEVNDAFAEGTVVETDDMGVPIDPIGENTFFLDNYPVTVKAQPLGNILASRQGAMSVFGTISDPLDVDWYQFDLNYDDLALPPDNTFPIDEVGLVFDVDYADGLSRPDTVIAVYDLFGELLYYSNDSNLEADQAANNDQLSDLLRGSLGQADPFIGPIVLEAGRNAEEDFSNIFGFTFNTFFVAVSSAFQLPTPIATDSVQTASVLGDPSRGEQVLDFTGGDTSFSLNPNLVPGVLEGEYQLEIRTVPIPQGGFTVETAAAGDSNRPRAQGQIIISSNIIENSRKWGVTVEDGFRDLPTYQGDLFTPQPGDDVTAELDSRDFRSRAHTQFTTGQYVPHAAAPRAIPGLNEERLIPGITISNNVIANGREGGLQIHGDPNGFMITTYDLNELISLQRDFTGADLNGPQFTIWDHQRNSQIFEFTTDGAVNVGRIPVRVNESAMDDAAGVRSTTVSPVNPGTLRFMVANALEHAIRSSDLDVKVYRGELDTLFIEGAVEIGDPDVIFGSYSSAFFPPDSRGGTGLPLITADKVQQGAVPYARVVNNTLVGRSGNLGVGVGETNVSVGDVGIELGDNASPTLLNNIVANFDVGIQADLSSNDSVADRGTYVGGTQFVDQSQFQIDSILQSIVNDADAFSPFLLGHGLAAFGGFFGLFTDQAQHDFDSDLTTYTGIRPTILGGTLYKGNVTDTLRIGIGDSAILLGDQEPLFVDAANENYFLASDSRAIDSSISFLEERGSLNQLLSFLELQSEGITAPAFDALGITRVDDPRVEPPDGAGANVFIDRGALERADFVGPLGGVTNPLDNDSVGLDQDPTLNSVAVFGVPLTVFEIELSDGASLSDPVFGSGIDDSTVSSDAVTITTDAGDLVEGVDYTFAYNSTSDIIRLTPVAGVWDTDTVYLIRVQNSDETDPTTMVTTLGIKDRGGNFLQGNQTDGSVQFVIATGSGADFGDAPETYPTRRADNGARHTVVDGVFLGQGVDFEVEAAASLFADGDTQDDGVLFNSDPLLAGAPIRLTVTASVAGLLNAWIDFDGNGAWDPSEQIFSDEPLVAGANELIAVVPASVRDTLLVDNSGDTPMDLEQANTFGRFRFSTQGALQPTGEAPDGEVEDYLVTIARNPWRNPNQNNPFDVNDDNAVGPVDALQIITVLTLIADDSTVVGVDGTTGRLAVPRPTPIPDSPGDGFLDVNGDGFVTPLDALLVINELPTTSSAAAVRAASSGATSRYAFADPIAQADDDESLDAAIDWIARDVSDAWGAA